MPYNVIQCHTALNLYDIGCHTMSYSIKMSYVWGAVWHCMTFQCHQICMTFGKQTLSYSCLLGVLFVCQMLPNFTLTHFTWFTIACSRNCCYSLSIIVVLTVWYGMKFSHCSMLANACGSSPFQLHSAPPTALHHTLHGEVGVRQVAVGSRPGALINTIVFTVTLSKAPDGVEVWLVRPIQ